MEDATGKNMALFPLGTQMGEHPEPACLVHGFGKMGNGPTALSQDKEAKRLVENGCDLQKAK